MMKMSAAGLDLLKRSEGCLLTCYRDSEGVPTIGWGHTLTLTQADVGRKTITQDEADRLLLADDLPRYEAGVAAVIHCPLTQGQFDALTDFAFNFGVRALAGSTLARRLNADPPDYAAAARQLPLWIHGQRGDVLPGLVTRRAAERDLFEAA